MSAPKESSAASVDKCLVYWDYENMPIPKGCDLSKVVSIMKEKLWSSIGSRVPVEFKVYIRASKVTNTIQNAFDINGITQIQVPSKKPESVDKRMMVDITFNLYEWGRDGKSRPIALISGDKDFGYLLSKIRDTPPISQSFLILLRNSQIDRNLLNAVDHVIQLNPPYTQNGHQNEQKTISKKSGSKKKKISLHFQRLNSNQKFTFKTKRTNSIYSLRQAIYLKYKVQGITIHEIMMFHGKINLKNDKSTMASYGINDGNTLVWSSDKDRKLKQQNIKSNAIQSPSKSIVTEHSNVDIQSAEDQIDMECEEMKTEEIDNEANESVIASDIDMSLQEAIESKEESFQIGADAEKEMVPDHKTMLRHSSTELAEELITLLE